MKIFHTADTHLDLVTQENVEHAMLQMLHLASAERPDLIVHAGDLSFRRGHLAPWVSATLREWFCALADIAPTIVVAGNHDMVHEWDRAGTLRGVLAFSAASSDRLIIFERPGTRCVKTEAGYVYVAALPYPNKFAARAQGRNGGNAELGQSLEDIVRGLGVEVAGFREGMPNAPAILVYHGSIGGAVTSTEMKMTTEIDPVLDPHAIPDIFDAVMCGHIHRRQAVGRAVYCGSPCPLDFGEAVHPHGVVIWEQDGDTNERPGEVWWIHRFVELEPKHRLITLDRRAGKPWPLQSEDLAGARVRILATAPRGAEIGPIVDSLTTLAKEHGAYEVKVQVERESEDRTTELHTLRAEASLDHLLDLYAERNPDAKEHLEALKALGAEIDGELPPEVKALERLADWELVGFEATNWRCYPTVPRQTLATFGRLVGIEGENGSGKTVATEIEPFALWGRVPRGVKHQGKLVRYGADEMSVTVDFRADGQLWRVLRGVKLNTKGDGKGSLTLLRSEADGSWAPANLGDARETQALIERLVGPFDLYLAIRCVAQGDTNRLVSMRPSELKDTIQAALGSGIFEARMKAAATRGHALQVLHSKLAGEAAVLETRAALIDDLRAAQAAAIEALAGATSGRIASQSDLDAARTISEQARTNLAAGEEKARAVELERQRLTGVRAQLAKLRGDHERMKFAISGGAAAAVALSEHAKLEAELRGMGEAEAAFNQRAALHAEIERVRVRVANQETLRVKTVENQLRRAQTANEMGARELRQLDERLAEAKATADQVGGTPFGEKCAEAKCHLLALPLKAREQVPAIKAAIVDAEARHNHELQARGRVDYEETGALAERLAQITHELEELVALAATYLPSVYDPAAAAALRARIAETNVAELQERARAGDVATGTAEALWRQIAELEPEATKPLPEPFILAAIRAAFEDASQRVVSAEMRLNAAREREQEAGLQRATAQTFLDVAIADAQRLETVRLELVTLQAQLDVAGILVRAFGRDGLPFLLLERAIPAFEQHVNHFLASDDISAEVDPMRDLASGDQKTEVNIRFRDRFGSQDLEAASGKQGNQIGVALRAALAQIQAESHGLTVKHWLADECFASFDEKQMLVAQQMLVRLADRFGRVFFVSHLPALKELADTRLRVTVDESNGSPKSRLERVA